MFTRLFTDLSVSYASALISARHWTDTMSQLAYHHPAVQTLYDTLNGSPSGVFVHWGVYQSGKTTAVREAAWRLQDRAHRQVICLSSFNVSWSGKLDAALRQAIGVPADMADQPLSRFFSNHTTLVIDSFDLLMNREARTADTLTMVRDLIRESAATRRFNVLLVLTSWEHAKALADAGCTLVGDSPSSWTPDQLEAFLASMPEHVAAQMGDNKDAIMRRSARSGTPCFMERLAGTGYTSPVYAYMLRLEWLKGTRALYDCADPPLALVEARFPDRHGVFHHQDMSDGRMIQDYVAMTGDEPVPTLTGFPDTDPTPHCTEAATDSQTHPTLARSPCPNFIPHRQDLPDSLTPKTKASERQYFA